MYKTLRLCLVSGKFKGKCERKKNREEKWKKRKNKGKYKINSKSINYFYMFFQTHFT